MEEILRGAHLRTGLALVLLGPVSELLRLVAFEVREGGNELVSSDEEDSGDDETDGDAEEE
jgi:hypothetical protein